MDHTVDLRDRLAIESYTVSASDLLLTKLQVFRAEDRDLRDVVTLLKDDELAGGVSGAGRGGPTSQGARSRRPGLG